MTQAGCIINTFNKCSTRCRLAIKWQPNWQNLRIIGNAGHTDPVVTDSGRQSSNSRTVPVAGDIRIGIIITIGEIPAIGIVNKSIIIVINAVIWDFIDVGKYIGCQIRVI